MPTFGQQYLAVLRIAPVPGISIAAIAKQVIFISHGTCQAPDNVKDIENANYNNDHWHVELEVGTNDGSKVHLAHELKCGDARV